MISKSPTDRLAGVLLLASFLFFLGHAVTLLVLGAGLATVRFVLVYGILIMLSAMALYLTFGPHDRTLALFGAFGLTVHGLFIVLTALLLLAGFGFPEEFAWTFGPDSDAVVKPASATEATMDKFRTCSFIFLGLGVAPLGTLISWRGAAARWLGWLGAVSGILGFLGFLAILFGFGLGGLVSGIITIGSLSLFGFVLALGIHLVVAGTKKYSPQSENLSS